MDRYLVSGAIALLSILVFILLADLRVLPVDLRFFSTDKLQRQAIGQVSYTKQNVRRRSQDSIVWEDSSSQDPLFHFDSVLTLSKSSAQLDLNDGSKINLHENTMVILEPISKNKHAQLRLRFAKGNMRSHLAKGSEVEAQQWVIETAKASDVTLRSLDNNSVQVEILGGEVRLRQESTGKVESISGGNQITVDKYKVKSRKQLSKKITWDFKKDQRVYTHSSKAPFLLKWSGSAENIQVTMPTGEQRTFSVGKQQHESQILLPLGTSYFSLSRNGEISPSLAVHIWPAPKLTFFSPLPRDRIMMGAAVDFSWSKSNIADLYRLEVHDSTMALISQVESKRNITEHKIKREGHFTWSIIGVDEEGFEIPALYPYEIHSVKDPLSAPKLRPVEPRAPASKKRDSSMLESIKVFVAKIAQLFIPRAHAKAESSILKRTISFSWFPVVDADHYIIEISSNPDFRRPEVIEKVTTEKFEWSSFESKIYYWRVAAGQQDRKGLFSEAVQADLSSLSDLKIGELYPGVQYKVSSVKKSEPPAEKIPEPVTEPDPPALPAEKLESEQIHFKGNARVSGAYQMISTKGAENTNVDLTGFSVMHFASSLNFPLGKKGSLVLNWQLLEFAWKAAEGKKLPFQEELSGAELRMAALYRPPESKVSYGLVADQVTQLKRDGFEKVRLENLVAYGLGTEFKQSFSTNWQHTHELNLLSLDGGFGASLNNMISYHVKTGEPVDFFVGFHLDFRYAADTEDFKSTHSMAGLLVGIEW